MIARRVAVAQRATEHPQPANTLCEWVESEREPGEPEIVNLRNGRTVDDHKAQAWRRHAASGLSYLGRAEVGNRDRAPVCGDGAEGLVIAAAERLGVRCQGGTWRLPG